MVSYGMTHLSNRESSWAMAASAEEPVVAGSILERTEKDGETLDWLIIPADQRIIDDTTLEWVADVPGLFGTDDELECEEKENMEPEPKRTKLENCFQLLMWRISASWIWACQLFEGIHTSKHTTTNSFVRFDLSSIMRWSAEILSQSRVSASFSVRSRMFPATTGSSAPAAIAQLDSRFEKWVMTIWHHCNHSAICEILAVQYIIYWHSEPLIG